ncbi:MAG: DUF3578 domain-containing protein [Acholeplasmatales bacterium]|nr:DUF3578 domain-containing protein [Acholeplasmatales bacterium]
MKELFQEILDTYKDGSKIVDSSTEVYRKLISELPGDLRRYLNRDDLIVKGSMGQGNKSDYPWVSILNKNVTTTTQKGLYIVYLFKSDMSGFYITLNQGITNFEKLYGKKKYEYAVKVSNYFKSQIEDTSFSGNEIQIGNGKKDLGYGYERTTILSKYYPSNNFTEQVLQADLFELLRIYDFMVKHFETQSYDSVIKSVIAAEDSAVVSGDDAVQAIKDAVDPDDEKPFGFHKKLIEERPFVNKSAKFTRVTNPKVGKIDYLKKAQKDIKNGLIGEELAISYEKERLTNLNRPDLADKIRWVSMDSDAYGYDIESYDIDKNGNEQLIRIEVKTTSSRVDTEFLVSINEINTSKKFRDNYWVYRIYDVNAETPKFYRAAGEIEKNFVLDPVTFRARYKFPEVK